MPIQYVYDNCECCGDTGTGTGTGTVDDRIQLECNPSCFISRTLFLTFTGGSTPFGCATLLPDFSVQLDYDPVSLSWKGQYTFSSSDNCVATFALSPCAAAADVNCPDVRCGSGVGTGTGLYIGWGLLQSWLFKSGRPLPQTTGHVWCGPCDEPLLMTPSVFCQKVGANPTAQVTKIRVGCHNSSPSATCTNYNNFTLSE